MNRPSPLGKSSVTAFTGCPAAVEATSISASHSWHHQNYDMLYSLPILTIYIPSIILYYWGMTFGEAWLNPHENKLSSVVVTAVRDIMCHDPPPRASLDEKSCEHVHHVPANSEGVSPVKKTPCRSSSNLSTLA